MPRACTSPPAGPPATCPPPSSCRPPAPAAVPAPATAPHCRSAAAGCAVHPCVTGAGEFKAIIGGPIAPRAARGPRAGGRRVRRAPLGGRPVAQRGPLGANQPAGSMQRRQPGLCSWGGWQPGGREKRGQGARAKGGKGTSVRGGVRGGVGGRPAGRRGGWGAGEGTEVRVGGGGEGGGRLASWRRDTFLQVQGLAGHPAPRGKQSTTVQGQGRACKAHVGGRVKHVGTRGERPRREMCQGCWG